MSTDTRTTAAGTPSDRRPWIHGVSLTLGLLALWTLTHRFRGLAQDGVLYAVQALARVHPYFATDVMLSGTSQDSFTLFSPLYAALIQKLGIIVASTLLFALCTAAHLFAAWLLIRRLFDSHAAYLTVAVLICVSSEYGAWSIFNCAEDFLTARSLAEACVVASISAYYWQRPWVAAALLGVGMLIHPLMALPGLLLLLCLIAPARVAAMAAAVSLAGVALASLAAVHGFALLPSFKPMEPAWHELVEQRSFYIFLKHWRAVDWEVQLRPLLFLSLAWAVIPDAKIRKLCWAAALVGLSGLALAAIPDLIGPIPILLQGQAWRWVWISCTVALCMVAPSASLAVADRWLGTALRVLDGHGLDIPADKWRIRLRGGRIGLGGTIASWRFQANARFRGLYRRWHHLSMDRHATCGNRLTTPCCTRRVAVDPIDLTRWTFSLAPLALACAWLLYRAVRRISASYSFARFARRAYKFAFCPVPFGLRRSSPVPPRSREDLVNKSRNPRASCHRTLDVVLATFPWYTPRKNQLHFEQPVRGCRSTRRRLPQKYAEDQKF